MQEFIIYSVFQASKSELENVRAHSREKRELFNLGIPFQECLGVYKGRQEYSLQVSREFANIIKHRAFAAKQECILLVNNAKQAFLVYPSSEVTLIGRFRALNGPVEGDHTRINGKAYIAA